uniref:Uncharacterized protein n=1 Tax=Salix viminalis TaxID=40686 RepID=A0A6N2K8W9_SALVM
MEGLQHFNILQLMMYTNCIRDNKCSFGESSLCVNFTNWAHDSMRTTCSSVDQAVKVPHVPLLSDIRCSAESLEHASARNNEEWLDCLRKDHGSIPTQSGTCDAIISSR